MYRGVSQLPALDEDLEITRKRAELLTQRSLACLYPLVGLGNQTSFPRISENEG